MRVVGDGTSETARLDLEPDAVRKAQDSLGTVLGLLCRNALRAFDDWVRYRLKRRVHRRHRNGYIFFEHPQGGSHRGSMSTFHTPDAKRRG